MMFHRDRSNHCIHEATTGKLYGDMPVIWFKPVLQQQHTTDEETSKQQYECPLYRTTERAGTLSTTGRSTNFITPVSLPISEETSSDFWIRRGVALVCDLPY